jgi:hypothetical protein
MGSSTHFLILNTEFKGIINPGKEVFLQTRLCTNNTGNKIFFDYQTSFNYNPIRFLIIIIKVMRHFFALPCEG